LDNKWKINVFHIGGRGVGLGFADCLFDLKDKMSLFIFEADLDKSNRGWNKFQKDKKKMYDRYGVEPSIIPYCVFNKSGIKDFYSNFVPSSSSLFPVYPNSKNLVRWWNPLSKKPKEFRCRWGDICETKEIIKMEVVSLNELYEKEEIVSPNFLNIDVQGAEYDIIEGSSDILDSDLMGIICESEFRPLYEGQKLFSEQFELLRKYKIFFVDFLFRDHWFYKFVGGRGNLVVSEALFLRDYTYFVEKYKNNINLLFLNLSKLMMIMNCFNSKSYIFEIMEYIENNLWSEWLNFVEDKDNNIYLRWLDKYYENCKLREKKFNKHTNIMKFYKK
jgi:FkbM family methyltransferase